MCFYGYQNMHYGLVKRLSRFCLRIFKRKSIVRHCIICSYLNTEFLYEKSFVLKKEGIFDMDVSYFFTNKYIFLLKTDDFQLFLENSK